jgi:hypothetical protein
MVMAADRQLELVEFRPFEKGAVMFEDEVKMERRSSFLPLVLMVCLVALIVGTVGYVVFEARSRTPLSAAQATPIVAAAIQGLGPAVLHFQTGVVKCTADESKADLNYRLLEKAGLVKLGKPAKGSVKVTLTPEGERLLNGHAGPADKDGNVPYQAPLAGRQLLGVAGVEMTGDDQARVTYNWKWVPEELGDSFDAGGSVVKSFNMWERQTLISKYQADFYHGEATTSTLTLVRQGREWKLPSR